MYSLVLSHSKLLWIEDGVSKRVGEVYDEDDDKAGANIGSVIGQVCIISARYPGIARCEAS